MLTLRIRCVCGEVAFAKEHEIGRRLRCRCGRVLRITGAAAMLGGDAAAGASPVRPRAGVGAALARMIERLPRPRLSTAAQARLRHARDGVAYLGLLYLLGALAAWVLLWTAADRWWVGTVLLYSGRWVLLLPLAVLVPAAALLHRRMLLPLAAAAAIVVVPVMGLRIPPVWSSPPASGGDLRVVTFNVADAGRIALDLPILLDDWGADVVALQECGSQFTAALRRLGDWHHHRAGQNCLLSRHPIVQVEVMDRSDFAAVARDGFGGAADAVRYRVLTPHGPLLIANVHLETVRKGVHAANREQDVSLLAANSVLRTLESRRVRQWLDEVGGPMIVMGDFNVPVESHAYRAAWGDLENAFSAVGSGFGMTKYNGWIRVRIDHVLLAHGLRATRAEVGPDLGSDHRPVVVDVQVMLLGRMRDEG